MWHRPGEEVVVPGRVAMAFVRLPRLGLPAVYSVYLAVEGAAEAVETNGMVFKELAKHLASHRLPWICMGDWNLSPEQVAGLPWVQRAGAQVMATTQPTCHNTGADTVRDFAMMHPHLAMLLKYLKRFPHVSPMTLSRAHGPGLCIRHRSRQHLLPLRWRASLSSPVGRSPGSG